MTTLPSVTQILQRVGLTPDFRFVDDDTLERARARGKGLHKAIQLFHRGTLDEQSLHPEVAMGFQAYLSFVKATNHQAIASEVELIHPRWRFIGHPDRIGVHMGSRRAIFDWKMTAGFDKHYVGLQLAGYRLLWEENHPNEPADLCIGVHLKRDGKFALHELVDPEAAQEFTAALIVYRALEKRGAL